MSGYKVPSGFRWDAKVGWFVTKFWLFRMWLIKMLAGRSVVLINAHFDMAILRADIGQPFIYAYTCSNVTVNTADPAFLEAARHAEQKMNISAAELAQRALDQARKGTKP